MNSWTAGQLMLVGLLFGMWGPGAVAEEARTPTAAAALPAFADGPSKGMSLAYTSRHYKATLDAAGHVELQPLADGVAVGKPVSVVFGCHYYDPGKRNTVARPIMEVAMAPSAPQPLARPGTVKLTGRFADEVRFTMILKFAEQSFSIEGEIKDPPRLAPASILGYHARVLPTHQPGPELEFEQIKALMTGWTLKLTPLAGRAETYPYWKSLESQNVERVQIHGPWPGRELTIKTPPVTVRKTKAKAGGYLAIYKGMAPYDGYYIGRSATSGQEGGELVVAFD
jgi:hypothetical protein